MSCEYRYMAVCMPSGPVAQPLKGNGKAWVMAQ